MPDNVMLCPSCGKADVQPLACETCGHRWHPAPRSDDAVPLPKPRTFGQYAVSPAPEEATMADLFALDIRDKALHSLSIAIDPPEHPGGALVFWHDEDGGHSFSIALPSRCAFCGVEFIEDGIDMIRAHVLVCEKHPLRAAPPSDPAAPLDVERLADAIFTACISCRDDEAWWFIEDLAAARRIAREYALATPAPKEAKDDFTERPGDGAFV